MPDLDTVDLPSIRAWAESEDDVRNTDFDKINEAIRFLLAEHDRQAAEIDRLTRAIQRGAQA